MKTKQKKSNKLSKPDKELLKTAASNIGDKILFPEMVESAKKYLQEVTFITPIAPAKK